MWFTMRFGICVRRLFQFSRRVFSSSFVFCSWFVFIVVDAVCDHSLDESFAIWKQHHHVYWVINIATFSNQKTCSNQYFSTQTENRTAILFIAIGFSLSFQRLFFFFFRFCVVHSNFVESRKLVYRNSWTFLSTFFILSVKFSGYFFFVYS